MPKPSYKLRFAPASMTGLSLSGMTLSCLGIETQETLLALWELTGEALLRFQRREPSGGSGNVASAATCSTPGTFKKRLWSILSSMIKACDPAKNKCRCKDFNPSPSHDVFCSNCGCPSSAHSKEALHGKAYVQCFCTHTPKRRVIELKPADFDVMTVMADLLEKGTPETRICAYFLRQGWDPSRVSRFLTKLELGDRWTGQIYTRFKRMFSTPPAFWQDDAQLLGENLRHRVRYKR